MTLLAPGALETWTRTHHGPRVQAAVISFISEKLDELEAFSGNDGCASLHSIFQLCKERIAPDVSLTTIC